MTQARFLRPGDLTICPSDGKPERVVSVRHTEPGKVFVRTNRHDHLHPEYREIGQTV
jgi:hypothetical protein